MIPFPPVHPASIYYGPTMRRPTLGSILVLSQLTQVTGGHPWCTKWQVSSHTCNSLQSKFPIYPGFQGDPRKPVLPRPQGNVPAALLQTHVPSSMCACVSTLCPARSQRRVLSLTSQLAHWPRTWTLGSCEARLHHVGSGTQQGHGERSDLTVKKAVRSGRLTPPLGVNKTTEQMGCVP